MSATIIYHWGKDISIDQLDTLFRSIGWNRDKEKWKEALQKSALVRTAWEGETLIGMARTVEDGVMCMIYDICVHPDKQRSGIGKKIMQDIEEKIKNKGYALASRSTKERRNELHYATSATEQSHR